MDTGEDAPPPPVRLLALHGRRQCASVFQSRIAYAERRLAANAAMRFIDAPNVIGDDGQRTWVLGEDRGRYAEQGAVWRALEGIEAQIADADTPAFDGIVGFSEGAYLAVAALAAVQLSPDRLPRLAERLRLAVVAGGGADALAAIAADATVCSSLPTLHFGGEADEVVSASASRELAERVRGSFVAHAQGHVFPVKRLAVDTIEQFLKTASTDAAAWSEVRRRWRHVQRAPSTEEEQELRSDELDALTAIFDQDVHACTDPGALTLVRVRLREGDDSLVLRFELPLGYPTTALPRVDLEGSAAGPAVRDKVLRALREEMQGDSLIGMPCLFQLASTARDAVVGEEEAAAPAPDEAPDDREFGRGAPCEGCDNDKENDGGDCFANPVLLSESLADEAEEALARGALESAARSVASDAPSDFFGRGSAGGRCDYVVGLLGKPSAGKSTSWNVLTAPESEAEAAKMAAYPFTTIDPNISVGKFSLRTSIDLNGRESGEAAPSDTLPRLSVPSRSFRGRDLPVVVKDVAGLVPGACNGNGKGNQFLNELCDAHALLLFIDASAQSTREGVSVGGAEAGASDPVEDVRWLMVEVHRWMYANVKEKWATIIRRLRHHPEDDKFLAMFSGYGCNARLVMEAIARAGMPRWPATTDALPSWTAQDLHAVVAHVVHLRFPIVVALNKCDLPGAAEHVATLRREPSLHYLTVPCSALSEWTAWSQGGDDAMAASRAALEAQFPGEAVGVHAAVSAAVGLREPMYAFVVTDHDSCGAAGEPTPALRYTPRDPAGVPWQGSCVMLKPGTTVEEAFKACCKQPYGFLDGELVRAEVSEGAREVSGGARKVRVMARDERVTSGAVIRFSSTRKSRWQKPRQAPPTSS